MLKNTFLEPICHEAVGLACCKCIKEMTLTKSVYLFYLILPTTPCLLSILGLVSTAIVEALLILSTGTGLPLNMFIYSMQI